jgi:hypothetical protein
MVSKRWQSKKEVDVNMTQRSILAGETPKITIKSGANIKVEAREGDQVTAESKGIWGLNLKKVGDEIVVEFGGDGKVFVPVHTDLKLFSGLGIEVKDVQGVVNGVSSASLTLTNVGCLGHASAGYRMDLDCQTMSPAETVIKAGGDIRFCVRDLTDALFKIKDLGGYWEAKIGSGAPVITLKSGGDVILVTDQKVEALPPHFILGQLEKIAHHDPGAAAAV